MRAKRKNTGQDERSQVIIALAQYRLVCQRGSNWETCESLNEHITCWDEDAVSMSPFFFSENPGLSGVAIARESSFLSIEKASSIVGLASGSSWTHSRATCMHVSSLQGEDESSKNGPMNSIPLPFFHRSYACTHQVNAFQAANST